MVNVSKERMSREETGCLCLLDWGTKMVQEDATMKVSLPRLAGYVTLGDFSFLGSTARESGKVRGQTGAQTTCKSFYQTHIALRMPMRGARWHE